MIQPGLAAHALEQRRVCGGLLVNVHPESKLAVLL